MWFAQPVADVAASDGAVGRERVTKSRSLESTPDTGNDVTIGSGVKFPSRYGPHATP
jgi:hypothetical protein